MGRPKKRRRDVSVSQDMTVRGDGRNVAISVVAASEPREFPIRLDADGGDGSYGYTKMRWADGEMEETSIVGTVGGTGAEAPALEYNASAGLDVPSFVLAWREAGRVRFQESPCSGSPYG